MKLSSPRAAAVLVVALLPLMAGCEQVGALFHKVGDALGAKSAAPAAAPQGMPAGMMPGAGAHAPSVGFITLKPQTVPITELVAGRTTASAVAEIRPQVNGIIEKRVFDEGSRVSAGDILYQIDARSYQAVLDAAKADLARAEASVPSAQAKFDRYKELSSVNGVSKQDIDEAKSALLQAQASVESARSAVRSAEINLGYTTVKAPISGLIGRSSVTEGALVTASQALAMATIRQIDPIYVDLTASSTSLMKLRKKVEGAMSADDSAPNVTLTLEDNSVYPAKGRIISSEANVDESTDTVTVRSSFANPDRQLLPGMYVRAAVEVGVEDGVFLLPQRAVSRNVTGQATAYFIGADDKVENRVLVADRSEGNFWVVTKNVKDGDRLVVDGLQRIRPGAAVQPLAVELDDNGLVKPQPAPAAGAAPAAAKAP
jgi:membrane fusion protein (multidrug efflux system)